MSQETRGLGASSDTSSRKKARVGERGQVQVGSQSRRKEQLQSRLHDLETQRNKLVAAIEEYQSSSNPRWKYLAEWDAQINDDNVKTEIESAGRLVEAKIQKGVEKRRASLAKINRKIEQLQLLLHGTTPSAEAALRWATEDSDGDSDDDLEQLMSNYTYWEDQISIGDNLGVMCEIALFLSLGMDLHSFCVAVGARSARKIRCEYFASNMNHIAHARRGIDFLHTVNALDMVLVNTAAEERSDIIGSNSPIALEYPFAVSHKKLDFMSSDMTELGGKIITARSADGKNIWTAAAPLSEDEKGLSVSGPLSETIAVPCDDGTKRFLSSWQYMGDSLVDFYMRW